MKGPLFFFLNILLPLFLGWVYHPMESVIKKIATYPLTCYHRFRHRHGRIIQKRKLFWGWKIVPNPSQYHYSNASAHKYCGKYFYMKELLCMGTQSTVFQVEDPKRRVVALKIIDKSKLPAGEKRRVNQELKHHMRFRSNPYIVDLHGYFHDDHHVCMLMELFGENMDQKYYMKRMTEFHAALLIRHVTKALMDLHDKQIVHGGVSPENILFSKEGRPKLSDFGSSIDLSLGKGRKWLGGKDFGLIPGREEELYGYVIYCAPEAFRGKECGIAVDMWGLGLVLFRAIFGQLPLLCYDTCSYNGKVEYPPDLEEFKVSEEAMNLIESLLSIEPDSRPSCKKILSHPFIFNNVDVKKVHLPQRLYSDEYTSTW